MAKIHYDSYSFQPIAFVRTAARYRYEEPRQSVFSPTPAQLEFTTDPRFRDALADLDGFDRLWVVAVFHLNVNPDRTANWNPKVRPPVTPDDKKYGGNGKSRKKVYNAVRNYSSNKKYKNCCMLKDNK